MILAWASPFNWWHTGGQTVHEPYTLQKKAFENQEYPRGHSVLFFCQVLIPLLSVKS